MTKLLRTTAGGAALLAATSLAMPAQAATLSVTGGPSGAHGWSIESETVNGWGHHRRWHRHRGGGDVLAGILILGGAVAVAKAIDNSREREYRERDARYRDYRYRDYDRDVEYRDSRYSRPDAARRGIDGAIEDCVAEVERDERVATVDMAERGASGWEVGGELSRGGRYSCSFSADGRVRDIDIDMGRRSSRAIEDERDVEVDRGRYDDDYYVSARSRIEEQGPTPRAAEYEAHAPAAQDRMWERGEADDRYETAEGPDYALAE